MCAGLSAHLSAEAQPLVGSLDVICDNEEDLLTLKTQLNPDSENKIQKVKQIKPFPGFVLLICGDTC